MSGFRVSEYIVNTLTNIGVTDAFGIPGGVVLDLLYAMEESHSRIVPHLAYNEQGAIFSALGYAQVHYKLGVAYATRGPGVTNMITGIADAYYDSIPLLVLTAHSNKNIQKSRDIEVDQELDLIPILKNITKYCARIESPSEIRELLSCALYYALNGRKGPVLLDIYSPILRQEFNSEIQDKYAREINIKNDEYQEAIECTKESLTRSRRPVILIGDGIRQSKSRNDVEKITERLSIPVVSSRKSQDILADCNNYYGYIGSHGIRAANFILSKADLMIVLGNSMTFPKQSKSYLPLIESKKIIRIDIEKKEIICPDNPVQAFTLEIKKFLQMFNKAYTSRQQLTGQLLRKSWIDVCNGIKSILKDVDIIKPVKILVDLIKSINPEYTIISDVGNHELWLSLAYYYSGINNRILYSNSFGSLGCSLPKAIGAYYATNKPVISFNGDQGFQFNLQELQFISNSKIPIKIVVINNQSSGMIKSKEQELYNGKYIHTTIDSGYYPPSVKDIAHAYKIPYKRIGIDDRDCGVLSFEETLHPEILEIKISENYSLIPTLPIGNPIQNMVPKLPDKMYSELNGL